MENTSTISSENITQSLGKAWDTTKANIWLLAGFCVIYGIAYFILGMIPFVSLLVSVCSFIFSASIFSAFQQYSQNGKLEFNEFFSWSPRFGRLLMGNLLLIGLFLLFFIPVIIVTVFVVGISFFTTTLPELAQDPNGWQAIIGPLLMFVLAMFVIGLILSVFFFAYPFLVQYTELPLMDALRKSFQIGRNNVGQIILYFILSFGLMILGFMALGIGIVVTIPLIVGTQYYFMRSIIPDENNAETSQWDFMNSGSAE